MTEIQIDTGGRESLAPLLEKAVRTVLEHQGVQDGEVSLALLEDEEIRALNREHLGHDHVTDVISFALWEEGESMLGDVYLGVEQARRQAEEEGLPLDHELARLAVHGTLHVLGHDHPEEAEARAASPMYRLQERLVKQILDR